MRAPRLLLITPPSGSLDDFCAALRAVSDGPGVAALLRRPGTGDRSLLAELARLQRCGAPVLVHRRPDLALLGEARGVHLPERGVAPADARRLLGADAWIGVSRHDAAGLREAEAADYATLSPFGAVPGKGPALGAARFAAIRRSAPDLRVLALGGIHAETARQARDAGADGVAVLRGADSARRILDSMGDRKG